MTTMPRCSSNSRMDPAPVTASAMVAVDTIGAIARTGVWLQEGRVSEEAALRMADWIEPLLRRDSYLALLVERVDVGTDGLNVRLRVDGLGSLAREMRAGDVGAAA